MPSSIYSTVNTPLSGPNGTLRLRQVPSLSPTLARAETPNLIARFAQTGYFDSLPESTTTSKIRDLPNPFPPTSPPSSFPRPLPSPPKIESGRKASAPISLKKKSLPVPPVKSQDHLNSIAAEISGLPTHSSTTFTPITFQPLANSTEPRPKEIKLDFEDCPFRIVTPSLLTLEKAMSIALFFEQYYHALLKTSGPSKPAHPGNYLLNRARRLAILENEFGIPENRFMSESEKQLRREELNREENKMLRERRRKVDAKAFEMGRVIGHGAFGVVRIAKERQSGRLVAVKQVSSLLPVSVKISLS